MAQQGAYTTADVEQPSNQIGAYSSADVDTSSVPSEAQAFASPPREGTSLENKLNSPAKRNKFGFPHGSGTLGPAGNLVPTSNALPATGVVAGGLLGSIEPGGGNIAGAALGGMVGEQAKRLYQGKPTTSNEALVSTGEQGLSGAASEMGGQIIGKGVELAAQGGKAVSGAFGKTTMGRAVSQKIAPELIDAPVSATRGASSGGPATAITHGEVLQHAAENGIDLTPAQALQTPAARSEQTFGEQAALTGNKIPNSIAQSKAKLSDLVENFQDKLDPQRNGLSAENAGEHLQQSAEEARKVMKENVNNAYDQVKIDQADLAGDVQGALQNLIHKESFIRQPHAAVEQPVFQTTATKAALNDIQSMLSDPAMQGRQSIQSLRNLRTTLLEKGNDYGANALSDSGQRIYKLAASKVDDAIMRAAEGTPLEDTFREAGRQNKKLQELYGDKGSPLYRILNTDDPAKVTDGILNRGSVHEIEALKGENFDLGPLARQAVEDIKNGGYKVTSNGLGGYPDTFLRSLLGPEQTKELYLNSEVARRLAENYNPSGSGKVLMGIGQLNPKVAIGAQLARSRSMPQTATNFLPEASAGAKLGDMLKPIRMETDTVGVKWAVDPDGVRVSIPKSVAKADVQDYARQKLAEQVQGRKKVAAGLSGNELQERIAKLKDLMNSPNEMTARNAKKIYDANYSGK